MNTKSAKFLASMTLVGVPLAFALSLNLAGCNDDNSTDGGDSGGGKVDSSTPTDSGTGTLYTRLGGHDGITAAVAAIVTDELKDTEIASYFYYQVRDGGTAGHPTPTQIEACLVNQLGQAAGGPEKYPGVPADNGGWQCRDMTTAHKTLGIPPGTFDKFVGIAAATLKRLNVGDADIAVVGSVLVGTKSQVVQDNTRDSGPFDGG